jgi:hypothetical protein
MAVRKVLQLSLGVGGVLIGFFISCTLEAMACCGWYLSVGHQSSLLWYRIRLTQRLLFQLGVLHDS